MIFIDAYILFKGNVSFTNMVATDENLDNKEQTIKFKNSFKFTDFI